MINQSVSQSVNQSFHRLIRCVNLAEEMDAKDEELRETIKTLWPIQGNAMAFILVPPKEGSDTDDDDSDVTDDETVNKLWLYVKLFLVY